MHSRLPRDICSTALNGTFLQHPVLGFLSGCNRRQASVRVHGDGLVSDCTCACCCNCIDPATARPHACNVSSRSSCPCIMLHSNYSVAPPYSYERAGTIGFRCVSDASLPPVCAGSSAPLCGFLFPPYAFTDMNHPLAGLDQYVPEVAALSLPSVSALDWAHWGSGDGQVNTPTRMVLHSPSLISDAT